jgi:hypothetical protein
MVLVQIGCNIFQIPIEFLLSTEGSSARQNINQFGINPKWSWDSIHAGYFSEDYLQYTLSGIRSYIIQPYLSIIQNTSSLPLDKILNHNFENNNQAMPNSFDYSVYIILSLQF